MAHSVQVPRYQNLTVLLLYEVFAVLLRHTQARISICVSPL